MLKTFNCGVGFCIIVDANDVNKIKKKFSKKYMPYEIGFISKGNEKLKLFNKLKW
jgi:phosphoribosylaminoimidazole (AIR) synthetase|tara:strand:- start:122 stop:286 length:165 start_codon:yes stop_codon:yes gene_type:complete